MKKTIFVVAAIILGALVCGALDNIHNFGEPGKTPMDDYFLANSLKTIKSFAQAFSKACRVKGRSPLWVLRAKPLTSLSSQNSYK